MANVTAKSINEGVLYLEAEADLSAGAAVTAVRGTGFTCARTSAGNYTFTYANPNAEIMTEVLQKGTDLNGTPATAFWAKILTVTQAVASPGLQSTPIVITLQTLTNAATPAAADTTGACTLELAIAIRTTKLVSPI